jgi:hypothetical protein
VKASDSVPAGGEITDVDARVDELYDLPPSDFIAARNALARALRGEGQRDAADRVAKLRRPTIAAWAVNQAVRRHRDRIAALLDAGQDVRRAQRRALSGVRRSGLREATRTRRQLIDQLTDLAAEILADQGSSADSHRSDIAATFDAASADDDAAETVNAAQLAATLPVTSEFGELGGLAVLPEPEDEPEADTAAKEETAADEDTAADEADRERAAQRRREAIRAVEEVRRELAVAENEAREAADAAASRAAAAEQADRAAQEAKEAWRRLQREAATLHEQVARARDRADATRREVERHTMQLRERERELSAWPSGVERRRDD